MRNSLLLFLSFFFMHVAAQEPTLVVEQHALYGLVEGVDMSGYIVHDVFVEFPNNNFKLTTMGAGWPNTFWKVVSDCNFFYAANSGFSSEQVPCVSGGFNSLNNLSSRWMIGSTCNASNDGVLYSMGGDGNTISNWGNSDFLALNHVLFRLPTDAATATVNNRVQIGRFTTCGNVCVDVGIQYFENYSGPGSAFQTTQLAACFAQPCLLNPIPTSPYVTQIGCSTETQVVSMAQGGNGNSIASLFNSAGVNLQSVSLPNGLLLLTGLQADSYFLAIEDEVGCRDTTTVFVVPPFESVEVNASHVDVTCFSGANGEVELSFIGGTDPVSWVNNSSELPLQISNLTSGNYWFVVSDLNGCLDSIEVNIQEPDEIIFTVLGTTPTSCFNSCNGQLNWMAEGGTGDLTVNLNGAIQQGNVGQYSNVCSGNNTVEITDNAGCNVVRNVFINSPPEIVAEIQLVEPLCPENSFGSVQFNFSGGSGNLNSYFTPGNFIEFPLSLTQIQLQQVAPQDIFFSVSDANGCLFADTLVVEPVYDSNLTIQTSSTPESCWNTNDGKAWVELTNETGLETISWNDELQQVTTAAVGLDGNRNYTATITDEDGCIFKREVFVPLVDGCIFISELISPNGDGANDTWFIGGLEGYANATVQVLNRWGQVVFESKGYASPWDGKFQNEFLPPADYYYLVQYDQEKEPLTGIVAIAYE